jgi:hypothetical protein
MGMTESEYALLSPEQKVPIIIAALDELRLGAVGGYPSDYVIENGNVYWATVSHKGAPELWNSSISEFIEDWEEEFLEITFGPVSRTRRNWRVCKEY